MKNEQPKAGRPGETSQWSRWEGSAESRPSGYLQGEGNTFAEGPEQDTGIGKEASKRSDDLIAQDVEDQIEQDDSFNPDGLTLTVDSGEVTLEGYVARLADKTRAEEIVLDVEGVSTFHNNLRIAPERH